MGNGIDWYGEMFLPNSDNVSAPFERIDGKGDGGIIVDKSN